jgi:ABC-type branched-subunit amino acid transport system substrate-binding protein
MLTRRIGVLFSSTGVMSVTEAAHLKGLLVAVAENNGADAPQVMLEPVIENPGSVPDQYRILAKRMITKDGVAAIFGCCSSASRKAVLPVLARYGSVLFYPSVYEGFEYSPNVVYGGATPNQIVLPLVENLLAEGKSKIFLVGSDYVYAREVNRIVTELLDESGGQVVGEHYVPLGSPRNAFTAVAGLIDRVDPQAVLSTVVGEDTKLLYEAVHGRGGARRMIASLTTTEAELAIMEPAARAGHLTAACYFGSLDTEENRRFRSIYQRRYGDRQIPSIYAQTTYSQVHAYVKATMAAAQDDPKALLDAVRGLDYPAPQGPMAVDADNNHVYGIPRLGRSRDDGGFDIVWEGERVKPDPYLVAYDRDLRRPTGTTRTEA